MRKQCPPSPRSLLSTHDSRHACKYHSSLRSRQETACRTNAGTASIDACPISGRRVVAIPVGSLRRSVEGAELLLHHQVSRFLSVRQPGSTEQASRNRRGVINNFLMTIRPSSMMTSPLFRGRAERQVEAPRTTRVFAVSIYGMAAARLMREGEGSRES
jgi:hypothetical protein